MITSKVGGAMELCERQVKGVAVIDVSADLAVPTENPRVLRDRVVALLHRGERLILLNLSNVMHTDSSFLAEIVESYKAATAKGGILKLEHAEPRLRTMLHTTALESIFNPYDAEDEAIASFQRSFS
jgi:anti-anti-sigma factor